MSFEPPAGILDIGNATLRVGKLEVAETSGLNQGLQNIVKNDLLITETTEYTTNQTWGLKLPTAWVADFDIKGGTGKYVEFNFYNEGSTSNAQGYTLNFEDTSLTLKYDNGSTLASATIPTIVGTYRKVNIFFERNVVAVSIDGTRYLYDKRPSVLSRVISTTGSAFLNTFFESDHGGNSGFKNLRIVNGRFISDKTSNVSFIGSLGVGVNSPTESLDVLGNIKTTGNVHAGGEIELYSNLNIQQVSNTATIKATSNVVTEFPRSKKFIKYPRVALGTNTSAYSGLGGGSTVSGYTIKASGEYNPEFLASKAFTGTNDTDDLDTWISGSAAYTSLDRLPVANSATLTKFGQQGSWLEIKLPNAIQLHYTHVFSRRTHITERNDTADIWASNTGNDGDWVKLATINFNDAYTDVIPMVADINTLTYYQYFAIQITKLAWGGTYGNIGEWELYGTPEYDPEADGVDVVVKSVPNVPNTDWLEVYYDAKDLDVVTSTVDNKTGVSASDASISNSGGTISFDSTYKAWTFGGTTSRTDTFTSPISTSINGNAILSASMWFKVDVNNAGALFSISVSAGEGTSYQSFGVRMDTGSTYQLSFYFWDSDTRYSVPGNAITTNLWYHMVVTYDGASRKLYLNGENRPQTSSLGDITQDLDLPSSNLQLQLARRNNTGSEFFGSIANFRLFNRALTSDEIYQLYAYQKEYFGHGDLGMTLKAGRLGIGTSEPRAALDVRGGANLQSTIYGPLSTFETVNFTSIYATTWTSTQGANETELVLLTATVKVPDIYKHLGKHQLKIYYTWHWVGEAGRYDPGTTTLDTDGGGYYFFQFRTRTSHNGTVQNMHAGNVSSIIKVVSPIAVSLPNNDHSTLDQSVIPGIFTLTDAFAGDDITIDLTGVWTSDAYGQVRTNRTMQDGNSSSYERGVTTLCVWFKPII
jgi:hypothetical protein